VLKLEQWVVLKLQKLKLPLHELKKNSYFHRQVHLLNSE
jgi:hypothetical protein